MRALLLSLALSLAACAGAPDAGGFSPPPAADAALADVWAGLDGGMAEADGDPTCADRFGTYFAQFGVRGLACAAAQVAAPTALVSRAPVVPFQSGPHAVGPRAVRLDLDAENTFGAYDPAFVQWLAEAGVPDGRAARALAQPIYDRHLRRLARIYWLTHADLAADGFPASTPSGPLAAYAHYLEGGPVPDGMEGYEGGFAVYSFTDRSDGLLPRLGLRLGNEWEATYEANTAYGFWLRRRADGTRRLWLDGLRDLLQAFDAGWLEGAPG